MILHPSKKMSKIISDHFESLLVAGAFPEVKFENGGMFKSYSMFEYSDTHARLAKLVDTLIKCELHEPLGIFSRKQSEAFLAQVRALVSGITEKDVIYNPERFRSFADAVRGEALK